MLHPPCTCYKRLFAYHLNTINIPHIDDPDYSGTWHEDENGILFFHKNKDAFVIELCTEIPCNLVYQDQTDRNNLFFYFLTGTGGKAPFATMGKMPGLKSLFRVFLVTKHRLFFTYLKFIPIPFKIGCFRN